MTTTNTAHPRDIVTVGSCLRCQGLRHFNAFGHIASGVCFQCKGDGFFLYLGRDVRYLADADMPRVVRLEIIRQALACFDWYKQDEYLARKPKACRVWLSLLVQRFAATLDVVVYDRAMVALDRHTPRKWAIVVAKRAELYPDAAPMVIPERVAV